MKRILIAVLLVTCSTCTNGAVSYADDPLNQPLDSVGVSGYDSTLCNDKWNYCSDYDRQQFDTKYPGTPLESISLYPLQKESRETLKYKGEKNKDTFLEDRPSWYGRRTKAWEKSEVQDAED